MLSLVSLTAAFSGPGLAAPRAAWAPARHAAAVATGVVPEIATVPDGVLSRNTQGRPLVDQRSRPRRNRKSEAVRRMVRETILTPANFVYPLFIHDEAENVQIPSMPGCERHSLESMVAEAVDSWQYGVRSFIVFPKVDDKLKSNRGEEAYNPDGIVPRAVRMLKKALPESIVFTDIALDP